MASDIEVIVLPNFQSDNCYEILGCSKECSTGKLRKVYRDLSRKYHPDRHPDNDDAWFKFQKIYVAYSTIHDLTKLEHEREVINQDAMQTVSPEEARKAYEVEFGEYRGKYYGKGAIIGLPYSYSLQESLDRSKRVRDAFSFTISRTQFSFFRSWFIKKEINLLLLLVEILCTWGAIVLAILNILLEEYPEVMDEMPFVRDLGLEEIPHVGIIGGIAILLGSFTQHFWYGFTRCPIITDRYYGTWLKHGRTPKSGEISDIQDVCSIYFHKDGYQRSQSCALATCFPLLLVDNMVAMIASIPVFLFYLCKNGRIRSQSRETELAYQFSKSIGSLISIIGYYLLWVLGGNWAKVGVAAGLVANQNLYNAILFRKGYGEFLQSFLFGNVFAITIIHRRKEKSMSESPASTEEDDVSTARETSTDNERGMHTTEIPAPLLPTKDLETGMQGSTEIPAALLPTTRMYGWRDPQGADTTGAEKDEAFEASFDGFYSAQIQVPKYSTDISDAGEENIDYRGRKKHVKPVPTWYQQGESMVKKYNIPDSNSHAAQMERAAEEKNGNLAGLFQCAEDTVVEEKNDEPMMIDVGSSNLVPSPPQDSRPLELSASPRTEPTSATVATENTATTDVIAMYKSVKRRIEAEFFARVMGESAGEGVSGDHTNQRSSHGKHNFDAVPEEIRMRSNSMFDECSSTTSLGEPASATGSTASGFIPMDTAAGSTTQGTEESRSFKPAYRVTRSNKVALEHDSIEELDNLMGQYTPSKAPSLSDEPIKVKRKASKSKINFKSSRSERSLEDIPEIVDLPEVMPSADESEITIDRRYVRGKEVDNTCSPTGAGPGAFWNMIPSLTSATAS